MTYKEALDKLDKTFTGDLEWKIVVTTAIERQIAKKVALKQDVNLLKQKYYGCPVCDKFFGYQYEKPIEDIYVEHCPDCGQALDWGDT